MWYFNVPATPVLVDVYNNLTSVPLISVLKVIPVTPPKDAPAVAIALVTPFVVMNI
jgi:hypothetical protein